MAKGCEGNGKRIAITVTYTFTLTGGTRRIDGGHRPNLVRTKILSPNKS